LNRFIFATGIENSYPKVSGLRRDQMDETRHYENWRLDFELVRGLGVRTLRYGGPYYRMHTGPHRYDWSWTDEVLPVARDMGLTVIADLCHFGVPDWAGDFQNTDWPELFVDYAEAFARRYPWIRFYTPVNEIHICAHFSGKLGLWNERQTSDRAFVQALITQCRASLLSMERILQVRPDAIFIQSEAAEAFLDEHPERGDETAFQNQMRFFTFDFLYGNPVHPDVLMYLFDNGESLENYNGAQEYGRRIGPHCVMGIDYYKTNERVIRPDGQQEFVGPCLGWHTIGRIYYDRYKKPMMLTETNLSDAEQAPRWMWNVWHNVDALRREGVPVIGYTWYSLQNQVDWDIQLREVRGVENPNGLFDLNRQPLPAAEAYQRLIRRHGSTPLLHDFPIGGIDGATA
jgi:beta-glucosidase/6-phospho-beta-glucosidase/beta-galactosidase